VGFALSEKFDDPRKHTSIAACGVPNIKDVPDDMELISVVTLRKSAPFGSVGCCEGFQSSGHVAILNAINNAVGVRVYDLPALPQKVKAAMEAKAAGKDMTPQKYFLGSDMYEELEFIMENPVDITAKGIVK